VPHPRHEQVRQRYQFRCGYCGVSEVDAGGELTVDHYLPVVAGGDDRDGNLVYACIRCNQFKGEFRPTPEDQEQVRRVLHPHRDDLTTHVTLDSRSGELQGLTETGRFHIALLQLNRPALVEHRLQQRLLELLAEHQQLLAAENKRLRSALRAQRAYILILRRQLGLPELDEE
jgi:hypothetical protein